MITDISRDWGVSPSIVRLTTTDDYATITTAGYVFSQSANIIKINQGLFDWQVGDMIAIDYFGGEDFFTYNSSTGAFVIIVAPPALINLTNGHILVGNAANLAADVAPTGVLTLTNTGVFGYVNGSVNSLALSPAVLQYTAVLGITGAQIRGAYAAPILLIAAPVAGSMIVINDASFNVTAIGAPFAAGGYISCQYGNAPHGSGSTASTLLAPAVLIAQGTANCNFTLTNGNLGQASTDTNGLGIYLTNDTQAFTGGTNSITNVYIHYSVVPVA